MQFGTRTDPLSKDTIDSVLRHREVGRAKDLSAHPRRRIQVNQKALKLNGTNQLLVYADDVSIVGGNVHSIKKNTDASLLLVGRLD